MFQIVYSCRSVWKDVSDLLALLRLILFGTIVLPRSPSYFRGQQLQYVVCIIFYEREHTTTTESSQVARFSWHGLHDCVSIMLLLLGPPLRANSPVPALLRAELLDGR